jgi:hypothetical protein
MPILPHRGRGGIAPLFPRKGWVVSSTPWPHLPPGRSLVPIVEEAGWAPEAVWMQRLEEKILCLCQGSNPDHPAHSQTLYWQSYLARIITIIHTQIKQKKKVTTYIVCLFWEGRWHNAVGDLVCQVNIKKSLYFVLNIHTSCIYMQVGNSNTVFMRLSPDGRGYAWMMQKHVL